MTGLVDALIVAAVKIRRKQVSKALFSRMGGVVRKGPFAGLRLSGHGNTSAGTLGAKLVGLYEQEVLREIVDRGPYSSVINIGSADGYFPVGLLVSGLAKSAICYEITEQGRAEIRRNAELNGVGASVTLRGGADEASIREIAGIGVDPASSLVLCDIEGAEFEVLSGDFLETLRGATLIVELHDRLGDRGLAPRAELIARLPEGARHYILKGQPKDWADIPEIEAMTDNDRALVCSDGRKMLGEWLIVSY